MKYIQTLLSEELADTTKEIVLVGEQRARVKSTLYIQVEDANSLNMTVKGKMSQTSSDSSLALVNMNEFVRTTTVTEDGIYMLLSEELYSITLTATGSADITIKSVE